MSELTCADPECQSKPTTKDMCGKHYARDRRRQLAAIRSPLPTPVQRYEAKVDRTPGPDSCHMWTGSVQVGGYGEFVIDGRKARAHRWGFEHYVRELADDEVVRHTCDVRLCQNRRHWLSGTQTDNCRDATERDRWPKGEEATASVLTQPEVLAIRSDWRGEWGQLARLGRQFGVHPETVSDVVYRRTWAWLPAHPDDVQVEATKVVARERCKFDHELTLGNVWFLDANPAKYRCLTCRRNRDLADYYAKRLAVDPGASPMPEYLLPWLPRKWRQGAAVDDARRSTAG